MIMMQTEKRPLTANDHHEDGEELLGLRVGRDVAESDARHAGEREVERRQVAHLGAGALRVVAAGRGVGGHEGLARDGRQALQPAERHAAVQLRGADGVPDAGEPVREQDEDQDQQH